MEKNNQDKSKLLSLALSIVGSALLVFLVVAIYVNQRLLPDETNKLTKFIITVLISLNVLIILYGFIFAFFLVKTFLFDKIMPHLGTTVSIHRRVQSLDERFSKFNIH